MSAACFGQFSIRKALEIREAELYEMVVFVHQGGLQSGTWIWFSLTCRGGQD